MPKLVYNEQTLSGGIPKNQVENILGNFASEYGSASTYAVGDFVIYDGLLYKCTTVVTTAENFDSTKWVKTDVGKEMTVSNWISVDGYYHYRTCGNEVEIRFVGIASGLEGATWNVLGTLPEGCRPNAELTYSCFVGNDGKALTNAIIKVLVDGTINILGATSLYGKIWHSMKFNASL